LTSATSRPGAGLWRHSPLDALHLLIACTQAGATLAIAASWSGLGVPERILGAFVLVVLQTYDILIVSHMWTHSPWFRSPRLNALSSALNSIDLGESAEGYRVSHVRNHHRFNNDRKAADGTTRDSSSTFRRGENGEPEPIASYAGIGALRSLWGALVAGFAVHRLWRVGPDERELIELAGEASLRRIRIDRAVCFAWWVLLVFLSPSFVLLCLLPVWYGALVMVDVQNYYEHHGALPEDRFTNSVSCYHRLYNRLTFNDGYHQEHHLRPAAHWSELPAVCEHFAAELAARPRVVSPVPAWLGFLDRERPMLHRADAASSAAA
jgi:fatty acid desaturase